jgi:hypothetical protein
MEPTEPTPIPPAPPPPPDLATLERDANGMPLGLPIPPDFLAAVAAIRARVIREGIAPAA